MQRHHSSLLAGIALLLCGAALSWGDVREIRTGRDSLVVEIDNLGLELREEGSRSLLLCSGCERDAEGGLWVRISVVLPSPEPPSFSLSVLSQRHFSPAKKWADLRDTLLLASGVELRRGAHWGTHIFVGREWQATLSIPIAAPPKEKGALRVAEQLRISISGAASFSPGRFARSSRASSSPTALTARRSTFAPSPVPAPSLPSDLEWLARLRIGDSDHSTFAEDGVYALSYEALRSALSASGRASLADGLPVGRIALFTGPADSLPMIATGAPSPGNMRETALEIRDHGGPGGAPDGVFGAGDTLLFWGHGASRWSPAGSDSTGRPLWRFSQSLWSLDHDYYLALLGSGSGARLKTKTWSGSATELTSSHHYVRAEKDLMLRVIDELGHHDDSSGVDWFWLSSSKNASEQFGPTDLSHPSLNRLDGLESGDEAWVVLGFLPYTFRSAPGAQTEELLRVRHQLSISGVALDSLGWRDGGDAWYHAPSFPQNGIGWSLTLHPFSRDLGRLDGITLRWNRKPTYSAGGAHILHDRPAGLYRRALSGASGCRVLKIETGEARSILPITSNAFVDSAAQADVSYWVDCPSDRRSVQSVEALLPPASPWTVAHLERGQNAQGERLSPQVLVLTPSAWEGVADEYVRFRSGESVAPANAAIVRVEDIYRHYEAGRASPVAIRDYLRWARSLWPQLEAVLLLGDGHYDHRNRDSRSGPNPMPLFEYQHLASDDYYGALDEGEWIIRRAYGLDLSVGRVPVRTAAELRQWLNKQRTYEARSKYDLGDWRNRNLFVADDWLGGGGSLDGISHTTQLEEMARAADSLFPLSENRRLLMANYRLDALGQKGEASADFIDAINAGRWMTIYFGHGGAHQMADENLLDIARVSRLNNFSRPGIFGFFSCLLGRFDRPRENSLSEELLLSGGGGAVGIVAPTRESYPSPNQALMTSWMEELSKNSSTIRLGEALRKGKNKLLSTSLSSLDNTQKYGWLGDPMTPRLGWNSRVLLDSVPDTLSALQRIRLSGRMEGIESGEIFLQVEEQSELRNYSDTLYPSNSGAVEKNWSVQEPGRVLFGSREKVSGGRFSVEFIAPRKLSFGDSNAVIRAYGWSNSDALRGGLVASEIAIHGTDPAADTLNDVTPPEVRSWICGDSPERSGYLAQRVELPLPACITVEVTDSTGVDQSTLPDEGVSWELVGVGSPRHPSFAEQSGKRVLFHLPLDLYRPEGSYLLRIRAQDLLGNAIERDWELELASSVRRGLFDLVNVPNPMKDRTTFRFKLSDKSASVAIRIYSIDGKLLRILKNVVSGVTVWDGRDAWKNRVANGLYYYQVEAVVKESDPLTGKVKKRRFTQLQKLVVSR